MDAPQGPSSQGTRNIVSFVERFLGTESASGVVLLVATIAALAFANSPLGPRFLAVWHTAVPLRAFTFAFERDLHFWISEGLMTFFFFVVGLEIRQEMHDGELSSIKRATLPLAAALGGMIAPALIFVALNFGRASVRGWGVPTATDIAFAVAAITLLGKQLPSTLRILLLALAVIDDVGAIVVIAVFYAKGFALRGMLVMAIGIAAIVTMQRLKFGRAALYIPPAVTIWVGALMAGVHPTLAGVVVGLLTPVARGKDLAQRWHRWVAFAIMPLFALASAGVTLRAPAFHGDAKMTFWGIFLGLVVGKPLGILLTVALSVRSGIAALPTRATFRHVVIVAMAGGIGFTMALFVAHLAFDDQNVLESAKLSILCASICSACATLITGKAVLRQPA